MGLDRKGVFLSLSAILIVGVLFVVFAPTSQRDLETGSRLHAQEIVSQLNALETNELDVWLEHVSRSALNALAAGVELGRYIDRDSFVDAFGACILSEQGTACGGVDSPESPIELLTDLADFYVDELGYEDVSIELRDINISELGARSVIVRGTFHVNVSDSANRLSLNRVVQRDVVISLEGLRDPLASLDGIDQRFEFVSAIAWTLDDVFEHAVEGTYVLTGEAYPGVLYFDRFSDVRVVSYGHQTIHFLFPPSGGTPQESHIDFQRILDDSPPCLLELSRVGLGFPNEHIYIDPLFNTYYGIFDSFSEVYADSYSVRFVGECE